MVQIDNRYLIDKILPSTFIMRDDLLKNEELLKKILPFVSSSFDNTLFMNNVDAFDYYTKQNVNAFDIAGSEVRISFNLIKELLTNKGMYDYLCNNLSDAHTDIGISICLLDETGLVAKYEINKANLAYIILSIPKDLFGEEYSKSLQSLADFVRIRTDEQALSENFEGTLWPCHIDGEYYEYPIIDLIRILTMDDKQYRSLFLKNYSEYIKIAKENNYGFKIDYPKEIVAYMLVDFCEREDIFTKYIIPNYSFERYMNIRNYIDVDFESVNKYNKSDDVDSSGKSEVDSITLNPKLKEAVLTGMNNEYSVLEKAMYIYIRLCNILTYDEESFITSNSNERTGVHSDISNIINITSSYNEVVSYEFMLIYAKFLKELGITYSLKLNSMAGYSNSKSKISFRQGEYLVDIDLFKDIIQNDMSNIKIGKPLSSIRCINKNETTVKKFNETLYEVYSSYLRDISNHELFNKSLSEYKKKYAKSEKISRNNKLFILMKLIARGDLKGIDSVNYVKTVYDNIFADDDSVSLTLAGLTKYDHVRPVYIVSLFENGNYTYFVCNPSDTSYLEKVSKDELLDKLTNGNVFIIDEHGVPGLDDKEETKEGMLDDTRVEGKSEGSSTRR
jgi:hypothetical protein